MKEQYVMRAPPYTYPPTKIKETLPGWFFFCPHAWTMKLYFDMLRHLWRIYAEYTK